MERQQRNIYTPQMSSNLKAVGQQLWVLINDKWVQSSHVGPVALALDKWMARNGYNIPEWEQILSQVEVLDPSDSEYMDIILRYLPRRLELGGIDFCQDVF